jgi:hypothetical protein
MHSPKLGRQKEPEKNPGFTAAGIMVKRISLVP